MYFLKIMPVVFILSMFCLNELYSQFISSEEPNSIAIQPQGYSISPPGALSNTITVNGLDNFSLGVDFGEPHIATNPRDPFNSICAFNINNFYYTLNGFDWTKIPVLFSGFSVLGDPVMAFDSLGNAFYVQLYQNFSTYGVCIAKSTNKGVNWTSFNNVFSTTVGLCDKEWIASDMTAGPYSNNLYIGWRQFGSSGMRVVKSSNSGADWTPPQTFSGNQGAYLAVGANGNVQGGSVYFASYTGSSILVNRSTDGGQNFSSQVTATVFTPGGTQCAGRFTVKDCIRMDGFPRMAADNSYTSTRGNVYVVYCRNPGTQDVCDINLVRSTDYGVSWSAPVRVNDDLTTTDQWLPAISVDSKTGKIFISWFDSREDPTGNLMTKVYGTVSTNGGISFTPNKPISNALFNPNVGAVGQPGGEKYIGDYFGISAIGNTAYAVWMDSRNGNLGSFTGYYPDFAMTTNVSHLNLGNTDSGSVVIKIPSVNGPFSQNVKFTAQIDTAPQNGSINFSFLNGKDSISTYPDSVTLRVNTSGNVTSGGYLINVIGRGTQGPPIHLRKIDLLVNSSYLVVGTNRPNICDFTVNGSTYNTTQQFIFPNSSVVNVRAISPEVVGPSEYVFSNWSDGGDTAHSVTVTTNTTLTANYKVRYKLFVVSSQGNSFGGNVFYDSGSSVTFGVTTRRVVSGGITYLFKGWNGSGAGSYTSPDSTGLDSAVTLNMNGAYVETARWMQTVGINNLNTGIPLEYNLYQNYPNPFNPATTIKFDVKQSMNGELQNVKLIVYDMLGKEIANLVNEKLSPGSYEITFPETTVNLSSGIYFYRINIGEFESVKRMILVK